MKKDSASKLYFGRAPIMADFFNAFVYNGEQVLKLLTENRTVLHCVGCDDERYVTLQRRG